MAALKFLGLIPNHSNKVILLNVVGSMKLTNRYWCNFAYTAIPVNTQKKQCRHSPGNCPINHARCAPASQHHTNNEQQVQNATQNKNPTICYQ